MTNIERLLVVAAIGFLAVPIAAQAQTEYAYQEIDYPGAEDTQVFGVNDRGDAVGNGFAGVVPHKSPDIGLPQVELEPVPALFGLAHDQLKALPGRNLVGWQNLPARIIIMQRAVHLFQCVDVGKRVVDIRALLQVTES